MTVDRICIREVDTATADESAQAAAGRMHDRKVGTLVVVDAAGRPIGMLTDRDLAVRVVARGHDAFATLVGDVMTPAPRTVRETTEVEMAISAMRSTACRRLPVVDDSGKLVGLVSLDDVLYLISEEFGCISRLLARESPLSVVEGG